AASNRPQHGKCRRLNCAADRCRVWCDELQDGTVPPTSCVADSQSPPARSNSWLPRESLRAAHGPHLRGTSIRKGSRANCETTTTRVREPPPGRVHIRVWVRE